MKQPLGVILAGGLATRMGGGDKTLLELAPGECLLDHAFHPEHTAGGGGHMPHVNGMQQLVIAQVGQISDNK